MKTMYQQKNKGDIFGDETCGVNNRLNLSALPVANVTCRYCAKYQSGRRVAAEKGEILGEQLLSTADMTQKLRISRATLNRIRPQLIANGVKMVVVAGYPKYLESSVDKLILKCAREERPMATVPRTTQTDTAGCGS